MTLREDRPKCIFVFFDFTDDALSEIEGFFRRSSKVIVALTASEILDQQIAMKVEYCVPRRNGRAFTPVSGVAGIRPGIYAG